MRKAAKVSALRIELLILLMFVAVTAAVLASSSLTDADNWLLGLIYSARSPLLFAVFSYVTILGNTMTVALVAGIAGLLLIFKKHYASAVGLAVATVGATLTDVGVKFLIERARPSGFSASLPASFSYPSGHAASSFALYGTLALILCALFPKWRRAIIILGALIIAGVGASRIYLGVHYPSDVLGGYLLAVLWFFIAVKVMKVMHTKN